MVYELTGGICHTVFVWDDITTIVHVHVYEVLWVVYELTGGICQIYSPVFVWDDITTIVYVIVISRRVMYGIYCTEAQGHMRLRVEVNKCHASRVRVI